MTREILKRLSWVVLIISVILLVWDGCSKKAQLSAFKQQMSKLKFTSQGFIESINDKKHKIVEQEQLILSQKDAIRNHLLTIEGLKKIKSQVRIKNVFRIDSVFVPYADIDTMYIKNPCDFISRTFNLSNEYYSFTGKTKEDGILLDSVSFENSVKITIGNKSQGLFKKSKPIVLVDFSNPYIQTKEIENVVIQNDLKWFDKKSSWF